MKYVYFMIMNHVFKSVLSIKSFKTPLNLGINCYNIVCILNVICLKGLIDIVLCTCSLIYIP